jgi:hypothetical protein
MSSAMVYGLLPLFLVQVLHSSMTSVGLIEGIAEGATLMKIASGAAADWLPAEADRSFWLPRVGRQQAVSLAT